MATSANYELFKTGLDPNTRRTFDATGYKKNGVDDGEARRLCPHVLGYKKGGSSETPSNERVLCWQLIGPGTNPQWRCYRVADLVGLVVNTAITWQKGTDYSKDHNCAKKEKFQVPY
jgi:hypothetical protein